MIRLYYGQPNDFDRGWTIESLWKPHTKNGRFGGWPPALRAKVIIFGVCTSKYGTNRTSECYSIPAFYYAEIISLISKYFNSKCPVVNTPAAIFSQQKWRPKLGILRWNVLKSTKFFLHNRVTLTGSIGTIFVGINPKNYDFSPKCRRPPPKSTIFGMGLS